MNIYLINIGCKVNFADLSQLKTLLIEENYTITETLQSADIVLINTCAVTNEASAASRQKIRKIRKLLPFAFIGVMGCYAQLSSDEIIAKTGADVVFGTNEKFKIHKILSAAMKSSRKKVFVSDFLDNDFNTSMSADVESRTRGFLKLQDGCSYKCSYCIVPFARGNSRSMSFKTIPDKINKLINAGYKEIVISGINLSDYKGENNENLIDLVQMLNTPNKHFISGDIRFRISSIEPQIINEKLIEIISESSTISPHFHIPLQSGCDTILNKMQRRYNTTQFRKAIELINKYMPSAFIGLDVISGFPTETEDNFIATKDFILSLNISKLHCFTYSLRQGTIAATMPQVPKQIKKARTRELLELSKNKNIEFNKKNINKTLILLPEKYDNINKITSGHTENYLEINIKTDKKLENNFYKIIVDEIKNNKLFGKLI